MTDIAHTPYDGSSRPFTIGLKPLDTATWIEIDRHLAAYLDEKDRHHRERPGEVFVEEDGTRAAQSELLAMLVAHLTERFPDDYRREGDVLYLPRVSRTVRLADADEPPLRCAARLVQEDLVIMRRAADGWRLVAGSLCFPSSWSLREKFGHPLQDIHRPVPGFGPDTRNAMLIDRIFDKLAVDQPVERMNWSLQDDPDLHHPLSNADKTRRGFETPIRFADPGSTGFIRVERQTLRKLPLSGDIVFTIRIHLDAIGTLSRQPDRARLASSLAAQLAGLDDGQIAYKGLSAERDRVVETLRSIAAG